MLASSVLGQFGDAHSRNRTVGTFRPVRPDGPVTIRFPVVCLARSAGQYVIDPPAGRHGVQKSMSRSVSPCLPHAIAGGSAFSAEYAFKCFGIQTRLGKQAFQLPVLPFEFLRSFGLWNAHSVEPRPPRVKRCVAESMLSERFLDRDAGLRLLKESSDLLTF